MKSRDFKSLQDKIPNDGNIYLELLDDEQGKTNAILHFTTPEKDQNQYMDVDTYKVRTWDSESGDPDKIQFLFKMTVREDGTFNITFTDSPVYGESYNDLQVYFSLLPYIYSLSPEKFTQVFRVPESNEIH